MFLWEKLSTPNLYDYYLSLQSWTLDCETQKCELLTYPPSNGIIQFLLFDFADEKSIIATGAAGFVKEPCVLLGGVSPSSVRYTIECSVCSVCRVPYPRV